MDKYPLNRGHLLVVPKQHYQFLTDMKDDHAAKLFEMVNMLSKHVWKVVKADGLNISQSNGIAASQDIFHVHIHVIPRFNDDTTDDSWPSRKTFTEKEIQSIYDQHVKKDQYQILNKIKILIISYPNILKYLIL